MVIIQSCTWEHRNDPEVPES